MSTQQELGRQQRIAAILQQLTPLYMRQTDLYRVWGNMGNKPEELTAVQEEIAALESEHDRLRGA